MALDLLYMLAMPTDEAAVPLVGQVMNQDGFEAHRRLSA